MSDKPVKIAKFNSYIEAELAKQLLEDYQIRSFVSGQNTANAYAGLSAVADVQLFVMESQAQEAIEILNSQQKQEK